MRPTEEQVKDFQVGPSAVFPEVKEELKRLIDANVGSLSHRSEKFSQMSGDSVRVLREYFKIPADYDIYWVSSATHAMQIVSSATNHTIVHASNGEFGDKWAVESIHAAYANHMSHHPTPLKHADGTRVDVPEIVDSAQLRHSAVRHVMIAATANETSTGIQYKPSEITDLRHETTRDDIMTAIDATSSFGALEYDFTSADAWFLSVQKALGMPAGMGILIVSPRFREAAEARSELLKGVVSQKLPYDNLTTIATAYAGTPKVLAAREKAFQQTATPNVLSIGAVRAAVDAIGDRYGSVQSLSRVTERKAHALYDYFDKHNSLRPAVAPGNARSLTVAVIKGEKEEIARTREACKKAGFTLGSGYGKGKDTQFRIANFPIHSSSDHVALLEVIDAQRGPREV